MKELKFIKEEYINPTPILYLCRGVPETPLRTRDYNTAVNIVKSDKQNEVSTLTFEIPHSKDRKITIDDCDKLVKFENDYYIIKEIEVDDGNTPSIKVSCESESTELKGCYCEHINAIGVSPYNMYLAIMNAVRHPIDLTKNYKWAGTDVVNKFRHLQTEDEQSVYQNLVEMSSVFNGWLELTTDENSQNWIFLRTQEIDDGKFIKKNLDMKTLNITADSKEIFTQVEMFGKQDELTGEEINIMTVNPTGQSYLENYSYYLAKGIPTSNIDNEPKYQQLKVIRDEKYITPQDLYDMGIEELAKCSIPKIDATLSMSDLSIHIDSPITPPRVGHKLLCIDKDIDFIFTCRVIGVERPYNNPADVKIEISNVNRYDTQLQNINHTISNADRIISTDPTDNDGNDKGDGKPYIKMSDVKDGDHLNVTMRLGEVTTLVTQTGEQISIKVDNIKGDYSELKVTIDGITSTVVKQGVAMSEINQKADSITLTVKDLTDITNKTFTQITQTATKISAIVTSPNGGASWELSKDACVTAIKNATGTHTCTFNNDGLTVENGGIYIKNQDGDVVLSMSTNGCIKVKDLEFDGYSDADIARLRSSFANMSLPFKEIKPGKLTINQSQFYINTGYTLDQYIDKRLSDNGLI